MYRERTRRRTEEVIHRAMEEAEGMNESESETVSH